MPLPPALPEGQGTLQEVLSQQDGAAAGAVGTFHRDGTSSTSLFQQDLGALRGQGVLRGPAPVGILVLHTHILLQEPPRNVSDQDQNMTWTDKMNFSGQKKRKSGEVCDKSQRGCCTLSWNEDGQVPTYLFSMVEDAFTPLVRC